MLNCLDERGIYAMNRITYFRRSITSKFMRCLESLRNSSTQLKHSYRFRHYIKEVKVQSDINKKASVIWVTEAFYY